MIVQIDDDMLVIIPEDDPERAWIESKLGLKKDGDSVQLRRCDKTVGFGKSNRLEELRAALAGKGKSK